jgi:hypothetical protein
VRRLLEIINVAIVLSGVPAVLTFYGTSGFWHTVLGAYIVLACLALLGLNQLSKKDLGDHTKTPPSQPPS